MRYESIAMLTKYSNWFLALVTGIMVLRIAHIGVAEMEEADLRRFLRRIKTNLIAIVICMSIIGLTSIFRKYYG